MITTIKADDLVVCKNIEPLKGNKIAPPLELKRKYRVKSVLVVNNHCHLDVGLVSKVNWVSCWETGEILPESDKIHWCHPSRFELL